MAQRTEERTDTEQQGQNGAPGRGQAGQTGQGGQANQASQAGEAARDIPKEERDLTSKFGQLEINWPKTIGFYGGISLAVGLELIEPELGLFIAAIPLFKMLNKPKAPRPWRFVTQLFDGAAQPVGGTGTDTVRLVTPDKPQGTNRND